MTSVFNFSNYRQFMKEHFKSLPNAGYGLSRRLADFLNVHTTLVSQVLKGKKTLTMEQAAAVCDFFALSEMETDYFLVLVQMDRAGSTALKKNLLRQLLKMRKESKELINRLSPSHKLSEEDRAVFYSDWTFSAVRQLVAIDGYQTPDTIADYFGLARRRTRKVIDFLIRVRMCVEEDGVLRIGPVTAQVDSNSAWVRMHHMNWREKSIEALNREGHAKLHFTSPLTLSKADAELVREMIVKLLEAVDRVVEPSASEGLFCLNVDWFEVTG